MATKKTTAAAEAKASPAADKKAALETVLSRIERECGKGSIMRLGENANMNVSAVSTGSLTLDLALGIGGVPKGRITEIYGPESSGKTTIALHVVAEVQRSTLWIPCTQRSLALISTIFLFLSRTAASRHWRLRKRW